jgi:hypothetical protein
MLNRIAIIVIELLYIKISIGNLVFTLVHSISKEPALVSD